RLLGAGMPKTSFRKNSDSPQQQTNTTTQLIRILKQMEDIKTEEDNRLIERKRLASQ
ncbi:hypothetical protein BMETH_313111721397, partial [methanotrophic bacterial endosymbiont of Bathymodiolus sp.]